CRRSRAMSAMTAMSAMSAMSAIPSRYQQQLTRCLSAFEIAVGLRRIFQLVSMSNVQLHFAGRDPSQHVAGTLLEFFTRGDVVAQARSRQHQRSLLRKLHRIERRHGTAGATEENQISAGTQDLKVFVESGLAHAVIHHVHA